MTGETLKNGTVVQCDFDGTITREDQSFLLLDTFAEGNWRAVLDEYRAGQISVGAFNSRAFSLVRVGKDKLVEFIRRNGKVRPGFERFITHCREKGYRLVIVSNGLDFYIEEILRKAGTPEIEVHAAETRFNEAGMLVRYIGPDGREIDDRFKESYTQSFLSGRNRVIYLGNGPSDMPAAKLAHRVFAIDDLLRLCRENDIDCVPFRDLHDVARELEN